MCNTIMKADMNPPTEPLSSPILVIEDDPTTSQILCAVLANNHLNPVPFQTGSEALTFLGRNPEAGALLVDIMLPDLDGIEVLREARKINKNIPCYMLTARNDTQSVVSAMKAGANDYFTKPFDTHALVAELQVAVDYHALDGRRHDVSALSNSRWKSPKMQQAIKDADNAARTRSPVAISGPQDTGKTRFARMIHERADPPLKAFVHLNLAGLSERQMAVALFGEPAANNEASLSRLGGYLDKCRCATLFIENVDCLDLPTQLLFLEWFKERSDMVKHPQRVRLICSTSAQIEPMIESGRFRRDLWYQLSIHFLEIPPLAERVLDLPMICEDLLTEICVKNRLRRPKISSHALDVICGYSWPHNLSELKHTLAHAVANTSDGLITPANLAGIKKFKLTKNHDAANLGSTSIDELTRASLVAALKICGGNRRKVADRLGVSLRTVYNMISRYGVPLSTGRKA